MFNALALQALLNAFFAAFSDWITALFTAIFSSPTV